MVFFSVFRPDNPNFPTNPRQVSVFRAGAWERHPGGTYRPAVTPSTWQRWQRRPGEGKLRQGPLRGAPCRAALYKEKPLGLSHPAGVGPARGHGHGHGGFAASWHHRRGRSCPGGPGGHARLSVPLPGSRCPRQAHGGGARLAALVPSPQCPCQARSARARLAAAAGAGWQHPCCADAAFVALAARVLR